ncbi:MAG TPA: flagellar basal-body rod protein FlgF [bacterium]|nr:flagellar basal-body rod protein FlgF [bacterium]
MLRGLYTGASGMLATMDQMDVISNNLANVSTAGFKRDGATFAEMMEMNIRRTYDNVVDVPAGTIDRRPEVGPLGTGTVVDTVYTDFSQGALRETGNTLDLALAGEGFYEIETAQGMRYTRDGGFQVNAQGYLVDKMNNPVRVTLPNGTIGPVQITDPNVSVGVDGTLAQGDPTDGTQQQLGTLRIVDFTDRRALRKVGDNYYAAEQATLTEAPAATQVQQGYQEQSNVNAVREMVRMIEVHRLYGIEEKIITTQDGLLSKAMDIPRS